MSAYAGFDAKIDLNDGTTLPITTAFDVLDVTDAIPSTGAGAVTLGTVTPGSNGVVPDGTLGVAAGRTIRFSWYRATDKLSVLIHRITF